MHTGDDKILGQESLWAGLGQLRRCLTTRGMFYEANSLFRVELNRTPLEHREDVIREFLAAIAEIPSSAGRQFIEASVRLQWGTTYVLLRALSRAEEEMTRSEEAFNTYCDEFDIADRALTPHLQALRYERLSLLQDPIVKLKETERLAYELEGVQSYRTDMCLSTAADLAKLLYRLTADKSYLEKLFNLHKRLQIYDESVSEDLCSLVLHRNDLTSFTLTLLVDRQKSLEWIHGFFQCYPYFKSPKELSLLYRWRALLLRSLRRMDEADLADKKADELDASGPSLGKWLHMGPISKNLPLQSGEADSSGYSSEDEGADTPFWAPWETVMGDTGKTKHMAVKLVLEWSLEDMIMGHITMEEFRKMVNNPELQMMGVHDIEKGVAIAKLRNSQAQKIASIIFPTDAIPETQQDDSYNHICDWLTRFPKGQRDKRLFCLLMLREARQLHLSNAQFWDLRIRELNLLLELYPKLPRQIREFYLFSKGSWLGALAQTYLASLRYISDFKDQKTVEVLSAAERYNNAALEELRQRYYPDQVAMQQRFGAQICMLKLVRIKQLAQAGSLGTEEDPGEPKTAMDMFTEIKTIRDIGLEKLKESDIIYTENEIHASWTGGLHGVNNRQSVSKFHISSHTIYTAINLLLAEAEGVSTNTVTTIWNWVQKYKARSLARTIGIQARDPPGLVSQIMASAEARPGYEEMLNLDRQIMEVEPNARFHLRRKLDVHRNSMKKTNNLLRQLIDLREGTPFDISDIAAIQDQIGEPFVLIDWFYLPPFVNGESGRLLLFTVKAGSQPTMDALTVTIEDTHTWQNKFLTPETWKTNPEENLRDEDARTAFDNMLGGLVAPLASRTRPGEILVLCPSTNLHRLPLHALSVKMPHPKESNQFILEGLIHRNPIVYIHSHSLLRSCFSATEHARYSPVAMNAQFLSGIPEAKVKYYDKNSNRQFDYSAGRTSITNLARWFGTEPMLDRTASKTNLMSKIAQSRLLHLHTHCNWDLSDPLDHHIELPDMEEAAENGLGEVTKLTTKEIFDIRVLPGTHVNVIACQGGVIEVKPGDEVMGLIPALLYSGASSIVSTLWSISDSDGAEFAFHFFGSFLRQCMGQGNGRVQDGEQGEGDRQPKTSTRSRGTFIDIAKAVRTAVRSMDKGQTRPLYHWAAFVLHGFWQYPLSKEDIEWLRSI